MSNDKIREALVAVTNCDQMADDGEVAGHFVPNSVLRQIDAALTQQPESEPVEEIPRDAVLAYNCGVKNCLHDFHKIKGRWEHEAIERFWDYLEQRGVAPKDRPVLAYDEYMLELREYVEESRSSGMVSSVGEAQARELLILADEIIDELNGDWKSRCIHLAIQEYLADGPFDVCLTSAPSIAEKGEDHE